MADIEPPRCSDLCKRNAVMTICSWFNVTGFLFWTSHGCFCPFTRHGQRMRRAIRRAVQEGERDG